MKLTLHTRACSVLAHAQYSRMLSMHTQVLMAPDVCLSLYVCPSQPFILKTGFPGNLPSLPHTNLCCKESSRAEFFTKENLKEQDIW